MKKFGLFITASLCVALIGCQTDTLPQEDHKQTAADVADPCLPGIMRVKVSESLAEAWLAERDDDGNVLKFDRTLFNGINVTSVATSFRIGGKYEKRQREEGLHLWFDVRYLDNLPATKTTEQLASSNGIAFAEPVYAIKRMDVQMNDPEFLAMQWHYDNTGEHGFMEGLDIGLVDAWNQFNVFGNSEVIVAVVDSGVEYSHEDLNPNMWVNEAELNGQEGVDDDGNGYKDDIYGYNFLSPTGAINFDSHGTHVAGTIAAVNNNGIGVCGIAGGYYPDIPGVRVMTLQAIDDNYPDVQSNILKIYQYAAEHGAVILNNSWGYEQTFNIMPEADKKAIDYFVEYAGVDENGNQTGPMKGGLAVFAAGNESEDLRYPAAYEKVMAVAALGPKGKAAYYTNYGEWVDVCAPGGDVKVDSQYGQIFSIGLNDSYVGMQGTSMACPHVTGVAALVLSSSGGPGYTASDLWDAIIEGCDPSIYDYNEEMRGLLGVGLINAARSLSTMNMTPPADVKVLTGEANANTVYLTADIPADDTGDAYYYHVYYSETEIDAANLASYESLDITIGKQELLENGLRRFPVKGLKFETGYHFAVLAGDFAGNRSSVPAMTSVSTKANGLPVIDMTTEGRTELKPSETTSYVFVVSDPDDFHTVSCSFDEGNTTGVSFATLIDGSYHVKIDASKMKEGDYQCTFRAQDQFGGESTYTIVFTIKGNEAPSKVKDIEPMILKGVGESATVVLAGYFSDPDGETLSYSAVVKDKSIANCSVNNGKVSITATAVGRTSVTITATDPSGASAVAEMPVVVRDADKPYDLYPNPVLDVLNVGAGEEISATIALFSSTGRKVLETEAQLSPFDAFQADLSHVAPGQYRVVVSAGDNPDYEAVIIKL